MADFNTNVIAEKFSTSLQPVVDRDTLIGEKFVTTRFEADFVGNGTVHFPKQTVLEVLPLAYANSEVTIQQLVQTDETWVLSEREHFAVDITIEDLKLLNISPDGQAKEDAMRGFKEKYETLIMKAYAEAGQSLDDGDIDTATNGGDGNAIIPSKDNVYNIFVSLRKKMNKAKISADNRWIVVTPDVEAALLECPQFINQTKMANQIVATGQIGKMAGFDIYTSNYVQTVSGVDHCLAGQGKCIDFAAPIRPFVEIGESRNRTVFSNLMKGFSRFGRKVFSRNTARLYDVQVVSA